MFYTNLYSPDTYETFSNSIQEVTGFSRRQLSLAKRIQKGDRLVCYMTKMSRWIGVLEVMGECYTDDSPLFYDEGDPFIIRFKVRPIVWLPKDLTIPIREKLIWETLTFTKDLPQKSPAWTGKVRMSLNKLADEDGQFLQSHLLAQQEGGKQYPIDMEEYRRSLAHKVRRLDKVVAITVPTDEALDETEVVEDRSSASRESVKIQALLGKIGEKMGLKVWIPKADLSAVLKEWTPKDTTILKTLPLNYDEPTLQTVELIDVLWLKGRSIVRAFEVEHTTAVYSGILRMADLLALQPNMDINLHIVAPEERRMKVMREILRPVFSLLEKGALSEFCTFLSYESLHEIAELKHLEHMSDVVLQEYTEEADRLTL